MKAAYRLALERPAVPQVLAVVVLEAERPKGVEVRHGGRWAISSITSAME